MQSKQLGRLPADHREQSLRRTRLSLPAKRFSSPGIAPRPESRSLATAAMLSADSALTRLPISVRGRIGRRSDTPTELWFGGNPDISCSKIRTSAYLSFRCGHPITLSLSPAHITDMNVPAARSEAALRAIRADALSVISYVRKEPLSNTCQLCRSGPTTVKAAPRRQFRV